MNVSIIVPCYNEQDNMATLVEAIKHVQTYGLDVEFILVNNGSKDNTSTEIDKYVGGNIRKVDVPVNKGYGYGIQQGILASTGAYVGWIHGDVQIHPTELNNFLRYIAEHPDGGYFMKGARTNRTAFELIFTNGQSIVNSVIFKKKMYDVAAIPAIFPREIFNSELIPNDFSIEIFAYQAALNAGLTPVKFKVVVEKREGGKSSWNSGLKSRIKQSKIILRDSIMIKNGKKVL